MHERETKEARREKGRQASRRGERKAGRQKGRKESMHAGETEEARREIQEGRQAGRRGERKAGRQAGRQAGFGHPSVMCLFHHRTQPARREANNTIPPLLPPILFTFTRCRSDARPPRKVSRPDVFLFLGFYLIFVFVDGFTA